MPRRDISADDVIRELLRLNAHGRQTQRIALTGTSSASGPPAGGPGSGGGSSGGGGDPHPDGMTNPMTGLGDLVTGGVAGAPKRLGPGSDGQVLTVQPDGTLAWETPGGTALLVQAGDSTVVATANALDFDDATFAVSATGTEANVGLKTAAITQWHALLDDDTLLYLAGEDGRPLAIEQTTEVTWT